MDVALWVPIATRMPKPGQRVRVLYTDGVECDGTFEGNLFVLDNGLYRYVQVAFWRPIEPTAQPTR